MMARAAVLGIDGVAEGKQKLAQYFAVVAVHCGVRFRVLVQFVAFVHAGSPYEKTPVETGAVLS